MENNEKDLIEQELNRKGTKIQEVEKDEEISFSKEFYAEDFNNEEIILEINCLFIGSSLSGKSLLINNLINLNEIEQNLEKINPKKYKRTLHLDKRVKRLNIKTEKIDMKFYEIASNLDFSRLYDTYINFLEKFDFIFYVFNNEINFEENLIFLENFKNSIYNTKLLDEKNAKFFFENKFYLILTKLYYTESDKINLLKEIRINKDLMKKDSFKITKEMKNNFKKYFLMELENEEIDKKKSENCKGKKSEYIIPFQFRVIDFDLKKPKDFHTFIMNLLESLLKVPIDNLSKRSNKGQENDRKNLTLVKVNEKNFFELSNKFFFGSINFTKKKNIYC